MPNNLALNGDDNALCLCLCTVERSLEAVPNEIEGFLPRVGNAAGFLPNLPPHLILKQKGSLVRVTHGVRALKDVMGDEICGGQAMVLTVK